MRRSRKSTQIMASLAVAGILGIGPVAFAESLNGLNVGTGSTDEAKTFATDLTLTDGGTLTFGSSQDKAGTIATAGGVNLSGGTIVVNGSGAKVSGALQMDPTNNKIPLVKPGTANTFIPDDTAPKPPVHSITAGAAGMDVNGVGINIGAPRYTGTTPPQADWQGKSYEGLRLDLKTTNGGDLRIAGGDFRVANIAFPIKQEKNAALRFDSDGKMLVSGGTFTLQGQPVGNPARKNYEAPSLLSFKAKKDLVITGGTYNIQTARMHLTSTEGKVVINNGEFNINDNSPYPGWTTFDVASNGTVTNRPQGNNTQDHYHTFASLDASGSVFEVNGGTFNIGNAATKVANYINMADKIATFNGGTFNVYANSNFGNNKAALIINGGTYNLEQGGYFGGRNFSGAAVDIRGGIFNINGAGESMFAPGQPSYSIGLTTEAAYLNDDKYNKTGLRISGGTFNFTSKDSTKQENPYITAGYSIDIAGGDFVRKSDGINSITVSFISSGQTGSAAATSGDLNISGGRFRTENPVNYTQGVTISRDDNIKLYNPDPNSKNSDGTFRFYTQTEIDAIYTAGNQAVFAPKNTPTAIPTKVDVLKALEAANNMATAVNQEAWHFEAKRNLNVTGGLFDLHTVNASSFTAGGTFNWSNANLLSTGGGGGLTISGKDGINILSGSIRSEGHNADGPFALQYDNRGKLDRDRWTLGKYLTFKTDGDMVLGAKGSATGPDVYYSDGMLFFMPVTTGATPGNLYLYSGSLTLDGQYRSTLNTGNMAASIIDGGTLNVITADRINRNKLDSASMWTMPVQLKSGTINLYNAQMGGDIVMDGGTINAVGDSAINTGFLGQAVSNLTVNGGTINLGSKAFIGAIKGDSLNYSPYITRNGNINIGDKATVNLAVVQPSNSTLTVGQHIGGIYAFKDGTANAATATSNIHIADGAKFQISNPLDLTPGTYTAASFVESKDGTLTMNTLTGGSLFYDLSINKNNDGKTADMALNIKNPTSVIGGLPGSGNIRDNAYAYADLLRNASGPAWRSFAATVANSDGRTASELLRQVGGESTTATANSVVAGVGEFRNRLQSWSKSNVSGLSSGNSESLRNGMRAWASGMGNWTNQGSVDGRTGYDASSGGIAAGFDYTFADRYTLGFGFGYAKSYSESKDGLSETTGDTWFGSLYTSLDFNPIIIDADVTYARSQNSIDNTFTLPGGHVNTSGDFGVSTWSAALKGSYVFSFNNNATKIAPHVGIEFLSIHQDGYSESGPMARSFDSDYSTLWTLPVGISASHEFRGDTWTFTPEVGVAYARDLNEFKPAARVTVPGMSSTIKSYGPELAPDSFRVNAGFSAKYSDTMEIFAMYNLDARSNYTSQGVNVGFKYSF